MTIESTKEPADGERLRIAMADATFTRRRSGDNSEPRSHEWQRAAAEFAAPYLARIAELEAENKALREAATPKPYRYNPGPSFGDLCDPNFVASEDDRYNEEGL